MRSINAQLGQIQLLIDRIQHHFIHDTSANKHNYEKLLVLSEQLDYSYGKALAHIYLAKYYQMERDYAAYQFHLEQAKELAERKDYFDIKIEYIKLEGLYNIKLCNEMTALTLLLRGIKMAGEVQNGIDCAICYKYIAQMFDAGGAWEDAEQYYLKAWETLRMAPQKHANYHRKTILIHLLYLACAQGNLNKAHSYWDACAEVDCALGVLPLRLAEAEIRILLLEQREEEAQQKVDDLIQCLARDQNEAFLLEPIYFSLMELLLTMDRGPAAAWCLGEIDQRYQTADTSAAIQRQRYHLQYAEKFGQVQDSFYEDFYKTTQKSESINRELTTESFKNIIGVYEMEKCRSSLLEERTDLMTAANRDELTGIYNRRYLSKIISKLTQDDRVKSLGYIMIDVDRFKEYNDSYGHWQGDLVLIAVAGLLEKNLPQDAYAVRYGGDEFSCLFVNSSQEGMLDYVQAVQKEMRNKNFAPVASKELHRLTMSYGIYWDVDTTGCDENKLIQEADQALYQAKKQGRNTYAVGDQWRKA